MMTVEQTADTTATCSEQPAAAVPLADARSARRREVLLVREAKPGDVESLGPQLQRGALSALQELIGNRCPAETLRECATHSPLKWTVIAGEQVVAMFGAARLPGCGAAGIPWMLCTPRVKRHWRALTGLAPTYIARMLFAVPLLAHGVSTRNPKAIGWLRSVGFTVLPPQPMGLRGDILHPYFRKAETCAPLQ